MKYYLTIIILVFFFWLTGINVYAMNTGFSLETMSEEDASTFLANVNITLLTEQTSTTPIQCFDVNEAGLIALGKEGAEYQEVCIYSSDGVFKYGYSFNCSQSFGVEWDVENINIYFVRSDVIISIDQNANILEIAKVQDTTENNRYRNQLLHSEERKLGDTKYILSNNMGIFNIFASSYSQLIEQKSTGEEIVLYDVNTAQFSKILTFSILIIFVFMVIALVVYDYSKKSK